MDSHLLGRRVAAIAGLSAIIAMGVLSACAREAPAPEKVTVTKTVTETAAPPTKEHQPHGRKPVHSTGSGDPGAECASRPDWSIGSRSRPPSPHCGRRSRSDATWPMAMFSADCMSLGSRPVWESR